MWIEPSLNLTSISQDIVGLVSLACRLPQIFLQHRDYRFHFRGELDQGVGGFWIGRRLGLVAALVSCALQSLDHGIGTHPRIFFQRSVGMGWVGCASEGRGNPSLRWPSVAASNSTIHRSMTWAFVLTTIAGVALNSAMDLRQPYFLS
jgi:hypothetical protein